MEKADSQGQSALIVSKKAGRWKLMVWWPTIPNGPASSGILDEMDILSDPPGLHTHCSYNKNTKPFTTQNQFENS